MGDQPLVLKNLRKNLFALLHNSYSEAQLNAVVALCHAIASASLKHALVDGSTKQEYLGLRRSDAAYDCIADLFRKDDAGNLVQFQTYFKSLPPTQLSDAELLAHVRRIVQSKTHQGLFRIYQENDPSLGKILRNIKIAIQVVRNFQETERFHDAELTPVQCDPLDHCPTIDAESLIRELGPVISGTENIPGMLAKLALFLRGQNRYRRSVPLVSVALAFRALYSRGMETQSGAEPSIDGTLLAEDARRTVQAVCEGIKRGTSRKYLITKKIERDVFDAYFRAIESHVSEFIMGTDGRDTALFESLRRAIPGLTPSDYRKHHRSTVEYLARLCRKKAVEELKKEK
ncbi:MAG TPA: hypothetical protein VMF88_03095 [Bacteroidota bacterium]|nr:hypothetical protein [Bacteroidota bacterium]